MNQHLNTGKIGEDLACRIIAGNKYEIVKRNFRTKYGEIDIIAKDNKELVFIEVKTLINKNVYQIRPEDNLTRSKMNKIKKVALWFANHNQELLDENSGWRIDLLALSLKDGICQYKHYKNIN